MATKQKGGQRPGSGRKYENNVTISVRVPAHLKDTIAPILRKQARELASQATQGHSPTQ